MPAAPWRFRMGRRRSSTRQDSLHARYSLQLGAKVILMFGGLRPSKGVPDLIAAFAALPTLAAKGGLTGEPA